MAMEQINIRLDRALVDRIDRIAQRDRRSRADAIRLLLENAVMDAEGVQDTGSSDLVRLVDERVQLALAQHLLTQRQVQDQVQTTLADFLRENFSVAPPTSGNDQVDEILKKYERPDLTAAHTATVDFVPSAVADWAVNMNLSPYAPGTDKEQT